MAERLGIAHAPLVKYELGKRKPRPAQLMALAKALNCLPTDLAPLGRTPTLSDYRERAGLTMAEIGKQMNRHSGTVSRMERGVVLPPEADIGAWAAAYGITTEQFRRAWRRAVTPGSP